MQGACEWVVIVVDSAASVQSLLHCELDCPQQSAYQHTTDKANGHPNLLSFTFIGIRYGYGVAMAWYSKHLPLDGLKCEFLAQLASQLSYSCTLYKNCLSVGLSVCRSICL